MPEVKQRMIAQDIAKGAAILMVMLLHIVEVPGIVRTVVGLLFGSAMSFFLFMTGYNYRSKGLTPWQNVKKRMTQIIRPFFVYTFIIGVIMTVHYVLSGQATVLECLKSYAGFLVSRWGTPYLGWDLPKTLFQRIYGPLWFIQYLVPSSIIFYLVVDRVQDSTKKLMLTAFTLATASVIMAALGWVLPWGIQDAPAIASIMLIAVWIKKDGRMFALHSKKKWHYINCITVLAVIAAIELTGNTAGYVAAGEMTAVFGPLEVYVTVLIAVIGSYLMINIARLIEKVPVISNCYIWLGQHSLLLLFMHLPLSYLINDLLGWPNIVTEFPMAKDVISIKQVINFILVITILYFIITLIDKSKAKKAAK